MLKGHLSNQLDPNDRKVSFSNPNLYGGPERSFCDCTKPCGLLTTALGITLLLTSALSAFALLETSVCAALGVCSNALVTLYAFSALVCGIVLVFIGLVIVVYTKKDVRVIVTTAKNFDKFVHYKQQETPVVAPASSPKTTNANKNGNGNGNGHSPAKSTPTKIIRKSNQQLSLDASANADAANLPLLDSTSKTQA